MICLQNFYIALSFYIVCFSEQRVFSSSFSMPVAESNLYKLATKWFVLLKRLLYKIKCASFSLSVLFQFIYLFIYYIFFSSVYLLVCLFLLEKVQVYSKRGFSSRCVYKKSKFSYVLCVTFQISCIQVHLYACTCTCTVYNLHTMEMEIVPFAQIEYTHIYIVCIRSIRWLPKTAQQFNLTV